MNLKKKAMLNEKDGSSRLSEKISGHKPKKKYLYLERFEIFKKDQTNALAGLQRRTLRVEYVALILVGTGIAGLIMWLV